MSIPLPMTFDVDTLVRFRPLVRTGVLRDGILCKATDYGPWEGYCYKVVVRSGYEMSGKPPVEQYTLLRWRTAQGEPITGYHTEGGVFPEQLERWEGESLTHDPGMVYVVGRTRGRG